jgi:hypothetical protein
MSEKKGFDDAINKILSLATAEACIYSQLQKEAPLKLKKAFQYKSIAMIDFKLLIEQLFKMEVFIDD